MESPVEDTLACEWCSGVGLGRCLARGTSPVGGTPLGQRLSARSRGLTPSACRRFAPSVAVTRTSSTSWTPSSSGHSRLRRVGASRRASPSLDFVHFVDSVQFRSLTPSACRRFAPSVAVTGLRPLRGLRPVPVEPPGGGGEIRTPGGLPHGGFQNRCLRPLGHSSRRARFYVAREACFKRERRAEGDR